MWIENFLKETTSDIESDNKGESFSYEFTDITEEKKDNDEKGILFNFIYDTTGSPLQEDSDQDPEEIRKSKSLTQTPIRLEMNETIQSFQRNKVQNLSNTPSLFPHHPSSL